MLSCNTYLDSFSRQSSLMFQRLKGFFLISSNGEYQNVLNRHMIFNQTLAH